MPVEGVQPSVMVLVDTLENTRDVGAEGGVDTTFVVVAILVEVADPAVFEATTINEYKVFGVNPDKFTTFDDVVWSIRAGDEIIL